jgi:hypothetical protein
MTADPTHRHDEFHRGLVPTAQLGTGTATGKFLRGDQTWAVSGGGWPLYTYDNSSTTDADPGSGKYRLNDSSFPGASEIYISDSDVNGNNIDDWMVGWATEGGTVRGYLRLRSLTSPGSYVTYRVSGVTEHTGYNTIAVGQLGGTGPGTGVGDSAVDFWPNVNEDPFVQSFEMPLRDAGVLSTGTNKCEYFRTGFDWAIDEVVVHVATAPLVQAILIDVNDDGTTIFTTQSNRPSIGAGTNDATSGTPDGGYAIAAGSVITVDIDQVGVGTPGTTLTVFIHGHYT